MKRATRESYGSALLELGKESDDIVVFEADLSKATKYEKFRQAYPDRHFNVGIAEQNIVGMAAGI